MTLLNEFTKTMELQISQFTTIVEQNNNLPFFICIVNLLKMCHSSLNSCELIQVITISNEHVPVAPKINSSLKVRVPIALLICTVNITDCVYLY